MQKRLPELLTNHELVGFYEAVWHARKPDSHDHDQSPDLYRGCEMRIWRGSAAKMQIWIIVSCVLFRARAGIEKRVYPRLFRHQVITFSDPQRDHQPKLVSERIARF